MDLNKWYEDKLKSAMTNFSDEKSDREKRIADLKDILRSMEGRKSSWDDEDRKDYEEVSDELNSLRLESD